MEAAREPPLDDNSHLSAHSFSAGRSMRWRALSFVAARVFFGEIFNAHSRFAKRIGRLTRNKRHMRVSKLRVGATVKTNILDYRLVRSLMCSLTTPLVESG
jgi:hypothetical protein